MAKLSRFGPASVGAVTPSRGEMGRGSGGRSTPAICVMYQDRNNYVVFKLKENGKAGGAVGNRWKVLLYRSATNRYSFRLVNPAGDILVTITKSDGMASLATAVNANATVNRIVDMTIVGTIGTTTDFSSSLTDYCKFRGGS